MVNLKKLLFIIFVLSFLVIVEYFIYINHLFISFNLCIFLYLWLSFIYKIYGLKEFEDKYKKNYPIAFKFSIVYLCKLIIRGFTIKWLLLKKFVIKLWTKKLGFIDLLIFVTILIISFFIYKYHRNNFLIEIGSLLFYYFMNILTFIGLVMQNGLNIFIKELIDTLQKLFIPANNFMYLCLTEEVKNEAQKDSKILNFVMLMKNHASEFMSKRHSKKLLEVPEIVAKTTINCDLSITNPVYPERAIDINGNIISDEEKNKKIVVYNGPLSFYLPKHTMHGNILYPIAKSNDYYIHNNILMPYVPYYLRHIEDYLNENNAEDRVNLLNNNSYEFFQDLKIKYICDVNRPYENQSNPKFLKFKSENPLEARRVYDILYHFTKLMQQDFVNIYSTNYLKLLNPSDRIIFQHFVYEVCHIRSIMTEYPNKEIYGLPSKCLSGEADGILIDKDERVDFYQLKSRTSLKEVKNTTHELAFSAKYRNTPVSFCFFRNIYFSICKHFSLDNTLISQTINIKPIPKITSPILEDLNALNNKTSIERINYFVDKALESSNNIKKIINDEK